MTGDPFRALPTAARLWAAAALCAVPLGLPWSYSGGHYSPGVLIDGGCASGEYCAPILVGGYVTPGSLTLVSQAPVRVFVVIAVLGLLLAAVRPRTPATQRLARAATAAVAIALAVSTRQSAVVVPLALALTLAAAPAWRRPVPVG